jgi:hypothetical protein
MGAELPRVPIYRAQNKGIGTLKCTDAVNPRQLCLFVYKADAHRLGFGICQQVLFRPFFYRGCEFYRSQDVPTTSPSFSRKVMSA